MSLCVVRWELAGGTETLAYTYILKRCLNIIYLCGDMYIMPMEVREHLWQSVLFFQYLGPEN